MEPPSSNKRLRLDSDASECNSPEAKRIRDELLNILEDSDVPTVVNPDLDFFIKSFENEISKLPATESLTDLEFLLEASDDQLGLPPPDSVPVVKTEVEVPGESIQVGKVDEMLEYGFDVAGGDYGIGGYYDSEDGGLGGLFECTDVGFGTSKVSLQPETAAQ